MAKSIAQKTEDFLVKIQGKAEHMESELEGYKAVQWEIAQILNYGCSAITTEMELVSLQNNMHLYKIRYMEDKYYQKGVDKAINEAIAFVQKHFEWSPTKGIFLFQLFCTY